MKGGRRYRYYITHSQDLAEDGPPANRVPAFDTERLVVAQIQLLLQSRKRVHDLVAPNFPDAALIETAAVQASRQAARLEQPHGRKTIAVALIERSSLKKISLRVLIGRGALLRLLQLPIEERLDPIELIAPATKVRSGRQTRMIIGGDSAPLEERDPKLIEVLAESRALLDSVLAVPDRSIAELARDIVSVASGSRAWCG